MILELGKDYKVRVVKYLRKGIIVRFIDEPAETAFIHLSQISPDFVDDVSKFVRLKDELVAKTVYDPKFEVQLTLKHLCLKPVYEPAGMENREHTESLYARHHDEKVIKPYGIAHVDFAKGDDVTAVAQGKTSAKPDDSLDKMMKEADAHLAEKMRGRKNSKHKQTRRRG